MDGGKISVSGKSFTDAREIKYVYVYIVQTTPTCQSSHVHLGSPTHPMLQRESEIGLLKWDWTEIGFESRESGQQFPTTVCSGSVVVTAYDFESGRPIRILSGGQYTVRLRSLHRAYPSLHPFEVVH